VRGDPPGRPYLSIGTTLMMELLSRLLEFIVIVWVVRFVLRNLLGSGSRTQSFQARGPAQSQTSSEPLVVSGEMKKDPNCGTYVSTELSLKSRYGGEVVHFCSRECQQQFLQSHSSKPA
jgi:YHS domain-containing protein